MISGLKAIVSLKRNGIVFVASSCHFHRNLLDIWDNGLVNSSTKSNCMMHSFYERVILIFCIF